MRSPRLISVLATGEKPDPTRHSSPESLEEKLEVSFDERPTVGNPLVGQRKERVFRV